jgi:hypothetical protein
MDSDPIDAWREQAREWGRSLLASAPWASVSDRVTLLLLEPPPGIEGLPDAGPASFWLTIDTAAGRSLPAPYGPALAAERATYERKRMDGGRSADLAVLTDDSAHRLLEGTTRRAMEARWQARHHEVVSDRLRRGEQYALRAGLLPDDAPERVSRLLFTDLVAAVHGLGVLEASPAATLGAAGEASAAICRLACFDDAGAYPPTQYLRAAAAGTRIGRRLGPWLDDLVRAVAGDDAAARRSMASADQVVEEVRIVLGELYRDRPWLRTPEAYALRAPR